MWALAPEESLSSAPKAFMKPVRCHSLAEFIALPDLPDQHSLADVFVAVTGVFFGAVERMFAPERVPPSHQHTL